MFGGLFGGKKEPDSPGEKALQIRYALSIPVKFHKVIN